MADLDIILDNQDATYLTWPLIYIDLTAAMPEPEVYTATGLTTDNKVFDIDRAESPNFARHIYLRQIVVDPVPSPSNPVRVFIDPYNAQVFVEPNISHAQEGQLLKGVIHQASDLWYLLPRKTNWIRVRNLPVASSSTTKVGIYWRKAYI